MRRQLGRVRPPPVRMDVQQCDGWLELGSCRAGGRNGEWNEEGDKKKEEREKEKDKRWSMEARGDAAAARQSPGVSDRGLVPIPPTVTGSLSTT